MISGQRWPLSYPDALAPGKRHGVVGGHEDQRLGGAPRRLQRRHHRAHDLVVARHALVVLGEVGAHRGQVGQERGNDHLARVVGSGRDAGVGALVAEAGAGAVRVGRGDVQIERAVVVVAEELRDLGGHVVGAARVHRRLVLERVHRIRLDVLLADARGRIAAAAQDARRRLHERVGAKAMDAVAVAILPVRVAVLAGQDAGAADGARRAGAERVIEHHAALGEGVDVRRPDHLAAVAACQRAPVIGNDEQDVAVVGGHAPDYPGRPAPCPDTVASGVRTPGRAVRGHAECRLRRRSGGQRKRHVSAGMGAIHRGAVRQPRRRSSVGRGRWNATCAGACDVGISPPQEGSWPGSGISARLAVHIQRSGQTGTGGDRQPAGGDPAAAHGDGRSHYLDDPRFPAEVGVGVTVFETGHGLLPPLQVCPQLSTHTLFVRGTTKAAIV